jgi:hypothetical protein
LQIEKKKRKGECGEKNVDRRAAIITFLRVIGRREKEVCGIFVILELNRGKGNSRFGLRAMACINAEKIFFTAPSQRFFLILKKICSQVQDSKKWR